MFSKFRQIIQEQLGLTKAETGIILFLSIGLITGGVVKLLRLDNATEQFDFSRSDSLFAEASRKIDSIVAADEGTHQFQNAYVGTRKLETGEQIDINSAQIEELTLIPGVGKVTAERILRYRTGKGRFMSVDELQNIKGIGAKKLEKIRPFVKAE